MNNKPVTATFLMPNPMHPNTRFMGIEITRNFASKEEAVAFADRNNWEIVCIKKN